MITLVNSKIAKELGVNKTTIANYIKDAEAGKNTLQTVRLDGKVKLIDSPHNHIELRKLVNEGRKYRPGTTQKVVNIEKDFYDLFDRESRFEIIRDLEIEKQIDLKYYYYKEGAQFWTKAIEDKASTITLDIEELLERSNPEINTYFQQDNFNLIDIGCGNGHPADLIIKRQQISNYIACDISPNLLDIANEFISSKFPKQKVILREFDFQKLAISSEFAELKDELPNLFIFIGNTIVNYAQHERIDILNSISRSMDIDDLFLISYSLDTEKNRGNVLYVKNMLKLWMPEMLGFDVEMLKSEYIYNDKLNRKEQNLIIDKPYILNFDLNGKNKSIYINQGDKINLWQHYLFTMQDILDELDSARLQMVFSVATDDNVLIGCKLKAV